jgi:hemoglobin-like flavoprotein
VISQLFTFIKNIDGGDMTIKRRMGELEAKHFYLGVTSEQYNNFIKAFINGLDKYFLDTKVTDEHKNSWHAVLCKIVL